MCMKEVKLIGMFTTTFGFTLNDGQSYRAETEQGFNKSHTFDPAKKITKIQCIIDKTKYEIQQINFYINNERLIAVGD